jgi:hypothetical protein
LRTPARLQPVCRDIASGVAAADTLSAWVVPARGRRRPTLDRCQFQEQLARLRSALVAIGKEEGQAGSDGVLASVFYVVGVLDDFAADLPVVGAQGEEGCRTNQHQEEQTKVR